MPKATEIDICVCTFRRSEIADTLRSIAAMDQPPGYRIGVIVADNDDTPTAKQLVAQLTQGLGLPIRYLCCPARNISIARNACLDASRADFVAFIDDDETASSQWLAKLVETAEITGADAVLGPVKARYLPDAPEWMSLGDFHSTFPVWVEGEIRTGYTCNVLLRMDAESISGRRFNLARGQTGGEDTEFFDQVHKAGGMVAYAAKAWVDELVTPERATFGWLSKRRYRVGQTHGHLLRSRSAGKARAKQFALASAKVAFCFVSAVLTMVWPARRNRSVLRGIMHVGVLSGLLGVHEIRQYGMPLLDEGRNGTA
ncbi:succinoglycan biosynthesis protein ExoM [Mesorhizobium albiziae]|uniref:Succinoglycan biosynthesis protein ExoM n=1 Tax=Neomesorhizobium albiziae TaxID=335020 RepID=A0A1I4EKD7_9HYPH|nr:glycosyltransferase family 2 protein [Mesorhizobium albiziae]GLS30912.1 glycosyl transferase family A [Mesorhizobium albiziae]SFL05520.1 succinoglycan biosynthesis protein ExoM [Mesorhizobium albiziae]